MATTAELQRLDALLTRLIPLSQAARGELIKADDWNTIVSTLIELGRALYSEAAGAEVPGHTHIDQVSLGWLDTQLRTLVSGGSLKDPIQEGKLSSLERKIIQINSEVAERLNDVNATKAELDRLATRELVRENSLQDLDRRVDGLRDSGEDIGQLRLTLDGITEQISTVQNIADQLRGENGEIIDVANLQSVVTDLGNWREQLRDANGEPLTGIGIDQKISDALNTLVTEDELQATLDARLEGIEDRLSVDLDSRVTLTMDQRMEPALNDLRSEINSDINRQFEGLDDRIAQSVADEVPGVQDALHEALTADIGRQFDELQSSVLAEADTRMAAVSEELRQADRQLREALDASIETQLTEMQTSLLTEVGTQIDTVRSDLLQADDRLQEALRTDINNQLTDLRSSLLNDVDVKNEALRAELMRADQALREELDVSINTRLETLKSDILNDIDGRTVAIRDELLQNQRVMREEIRGEFNRQISTVNQSLATVRRSVDQLEVRIGDDVRRVFNEELASGRIMSAASRDSLIAELDRRITTRVDSALRRVPPGGGGSVRDDFTDMRGIGPRLHERLQAAGVHTFADLAGLSADKVAEITGMSPNRVIELDVLGQARRRLRE